MNLYVWNRELFADSYHQGSMIALASSLEEAKERLRKEAAFYYPNAYSQSRFEAALAKEPFVTSVAFAIIFPSAD